MSESDAVIQRILKLLRMAERAEGNETEAAQAAEMAREMMARYNLDMATVELSSKTKKGVDRTSKTAQGKAAYNHQRLLMDIICYVNFVYVESVWETVTNKKGVSTNRYVGFKLIGREANVVVAKHLFDYLDHTMNRMVVALGHQFASKDAMSWKAGCAYRLGQRLRKRHDDAMAEQSAKARADQRHDPNRATALVVMEDYAQAERDANNDFLNGWEPGTTARRRAEDKATEKQRQAEWAARWKAMEAREEERRAKLSPEERAREDAKKAKEKARREALNNKAYAKSVYNNANFHEGLQAGDTIGLDPQVSQQERPSDAPQLEKF